MVHNVIIKITIMRKLDLKTMSQINGGKFIGTSRKCDKCLNGSRYCERTFYFCWIKFHQSSMLEPC